MRRPHHAAGATPVQRAVHRHVFDTAERTDLSSLDRLTNKFADAYGTELSRPTKRAPGFAPHREQRRDLGDPRSPLKSRDQRHEFVHDGKTWSWRLTHRSSLPQDRRRQIEIDGAWRNADAETRLDRHYTEPGCRLMRRQVGKRPHAVRGATCREASIVGVPGGANSVARPANPYCASPARQRTQRPTPPSHDGSRPAWRIPASPPGPTVRRQPFYPSDERGGPDGRVHPHAGVPRRVARWDQRVAS
ncbi:hypothetical protein C7408_106239 [Paraburkholderia caballeronis]|nr:hypothetical protein C7408_106239 [Paraburkholderia caballeronis]TDV18037.1 hypothetical protein C7406_105239 [Paraburkholderia caballeronis]TDV26349.1 hypothetical protein C7404_10652 [Paraburkholderia caballeronis]